MEPTQSPPKDLIFALDIGTRSVIGLAGRREGDVFNVLALETAQHPKRAMIDGQIEDIAQVARIAGEVKARMEQTLGHPLRSVSVAAAGRALKTCRAAHRAEVPPGAPISARTVYELENAAVNLARQQLDEGNDSASYYCVGHSVVRYTLDDYPFATILGHRGKAAEVEVIATFLPTEVVSSLRSCMELLDLDIDTLTLEPIAAMRAVIPAELRLLNLALADIGAGTSDIALSAGGSVAGYTMATVAGDEVTESIVKNYLVDFMTAETIKFALEAGKPVTFTDILGFEYTHPAEDILKSIDPAIEALAQVIAARIEETNGGPPAAVFLVGGGSRTPGLAARIAEKLGLDATKVALAGTNFEGRLASAGSGVNGPEFATPLGIALTAADEAEAEGGAVAINGRRTRLFTGQGTSVMDALLMGGYRYGDLMGRNGKSLTFNLNGAKRVVHGGMYTAAEIAVNGSPASLSSPVEDGDAIDLVPATTGHDAVACVEDFTGGTPPISITLNGEATPAGAVALLNGERPQPGARLQDFDNLDIVFIRTLADLYEAHGLEGSEPAAVNGTQQPPEYALQNGDTVETAAYMAAQAQSQFAGSPQPQTAAGESEAAPAPRPAPPAPAAPSRSLHITLNGRTVVLPPRPGGAPYALADLLELVDIEETDPAAGIERRVNGREAAPGHEVENGDVVELRLQNAPRQTV